MLFIDDEETEILVEIANFVLQQLMSETVQEIKMIHSYE